MSQDYQTRQQPLRRAIHLDPSVLATTSTLANSSYNSRSLVFIRYPEPQLKESHSGPQPIECHVLNPYPEPLLKDTFRATTQGTPASSPSRYLRSLIDHTSPFKLQLIQYYNLLLLNLSSIQLSPKNSSLPRLG